MKSSIILCVMWYLVEWKELKVKSLKSKVLYS